MGSQARQLPLHWRNHLPLPKLKVMSKKEKKCENDAIILCLQQFDKKIMNPSLTVYFDRCIAALLKTNKNANKIRRFVGSGFVNTCTLGLTL